MSIHWRKRIASFGLENDFCTYLRHATSCFRQRKEMSVQMDEINEDLISILLKLNCCVFVCVFVCLSGLY